MKSVFHLKEQLKKSLTKKDECRRRDIDDGVFINEKEKKSSTEKAMIRVIYFYFITSCHSLSLVVPLVNTPCTTCLSFYKGSFLCCFIKLKVYQLLLVHSFSVGWRQKYQMFQRCFFDLNNLMRIL